MNPTRCFRCCYALFQFLFFFFFVAVASRENVNSHGIKMSNNVRFKNSNLIVFESFDTLIRMKMESMILITKHVLCFNSLEENANNKRNWEKQLNRCYRLLKILNFLYLYSNSFIKNIFVYYLYVYYIVGSIMSLFTTQLEFETNILDSKKNIQHYYDHKYSHMWQYPFIFIFFYFHDFNRRENRKKAHCISKYLNVIHTNRHSSLF